MVKKIIINLLKKIGYQIVKLNTISQKELEAYNKRSIDIIKIISSDLRVLQGPFVNMNYPNLDITEATVIPKFIGSYESQLHPIIERIIHANYSDLIDVGCAEGYYAVGFASRMPNAIIHAFDINEKDLKFCALMASKNNVQNITYNHFCSPEILMNFKDKNKLLVFCDAEGYELELFTQNVIDTLQNADYLIELHDVINPEISIKLYNRFKNTHKFKFVNNRGIDNTQFYSKLSTLNEIDKQFSVQEHRGGYNKNYFMEWVYITKL